MDTRKCIASEIFMRLNAKGAQLDNTSIIIIEQVLAEEGIK